MNGITHMTPRLLAFVPMFVLLGVAAVTDIRARRIPNWLTLTLVMGGIIVSYVNEGKGTSVSPAQAWLGLLVGFALPFAMFALGAIRGGDVKLLAGIGTWIGPVPAFEVFVVEAVVGLVIVLVQCAIQGKLLALFRNSTVLAINLVNVSYLGVKHVQETGQQFRSIDRPLPYAVPVLIAVVLVVFGGM